MSLPVSETPGFQKCHRQSWAIQRAMAAATAVMAGALVLALIVVAAAVSIDIANSPALL